MRNCPQTNLEAAPERTTTSMKDERIILDWQDVNHESGRWADRWDYNLALYSILHPNEDEVLYLGKADGCTVRSRWNADDKHERVWRRIEDERGLFEHGFMWASSACRTGNGSRASLSATSKASSSTRSSPGQTAATPDPEASIRGPAWWFTARDSGRYGRKPLVKIDPPLSFPSHPMAA